MKVVKDIRLFKSNIENIDNNPLPLYIASQDLNATAHRIAMKLRENNFSFGNFDHLYLNYTTCLPEGMVQPALRSIDAYHSLYRYYDIGIDEKLYNKIEADESRKYILGLVKETMNKYFTSDEESVKKLNNAIDIAVSEGEHMLMRFKTKKTAKYIAVIYLRYLNCAKYLPLLCIYDLNEKEILRKKLPLTIDLLSIGEIQLSSKKVTVKPKKNILAKGLKPVTFELNNNKNI